MVNYDLIRQLIMMRMPNGAGVVYETRTLQKYPCGWECNGIGIFCESGSAGDVHVAVTVGGVELENQSVNFAASDHQSVVVQSLANIITNVHLLISAKCCIEKEEGQNGEDV